MGNTFPGPTKAVITDIDPDAKFPLKLNSGLDLLRKDDQIKVDGQWRKIDQCKLKKCGSTESTKGFQNLFVLNKGKTSGHRK